MRPSRFGYLITARREVGTTVAPVRSLAIDPRAKSASPTEPAFVARTGLRLNPARSKPAKHQPHSPERELFETQQRLKALLQALPVGVHFSDDVTCQHISGNATTLAQFDAAPEDNISVSAPDEGAAGRRTEYISDGRRLRDFELPLQRAVAENRVIPTVELEIELPSGRRWIAEASGARFTIVKEM